MMEENRMQLLCMALDDVLYGVELKYVVETVRDARITPLPFLPAFYLGVCSRMGNVTPVASLRRLCGREEPQTDGHTVTVCLRCGAYECGIFTREKPLILTIDGQSRIQGQEADLSSDHWKVKALHMYEGRMLLLVDVQKSLERMIVCG